MKKLVLFLVAILFGANVSAQSTTWCPKGATWYFKYTQSWYSMVMAKNGYVELKYTNDTTINSIECKKIVGKFSGCYCNVRNPSAYPQVVIHNFRTYYTYENNGVIYLYNKNSSKFDTVVNFNANIGDKWLRASGCGDVLTVTDTSHVPSFGLSLKQITTSHTYTYTRYETEWDTTSPSTVITSDNGAKFTEYVFSTSSTPDDELFATSCYQWWDLGIVDGEPEQRARFLCYQDDSTNINGCAKYYLGIENIRANNINFSIYPNPAQTQLHIETEAEIAEIKIVSIAGSELINTTQHIIDISHLPNGIYFAQIKTDKGIGARKIVVQR